jgi:hypothetical protein
VVSHGIRVGACCIDWYGRKMETMNNIIAKDFDKRFLIVGSRFMADAECEQ